MFGQNQGLNPGYGNQANVGYSPGQVGYVPAGWAKFDYQQQQFKSMGYVDKQLGVFSKFPIMWAAIWTPVTFFLAYGIIVMAIPLSSMFLQDNSNPIDWLVGGVFFLGTWGVALYLVYRFTIKMWINAIAMHMLLKEQQEIATVACGVTEDDVAAHRAQVANRLRK